MNWTFIANVKEENSASPVTYISFDKGGHWGEIQSKSDDLVSNCTNVNQAIKTLNLITYYT